MNPFDPQFEEAVPEGRQQQVGFNPTKTYDLSQEVLQEYERNERNRKFSERSQVEKLKTSITNKQRGIAETQAYYESIAGFADFSETAEKMVQGYIDNEKEKRKAQAQLDVLNRVWETGATDEEKAGYQAGKDEANATTAARNEAADQATRATGNTDVASWINNTDPYSAQYRAEALAVSAASNYRPWLSNALQNNTDILPEFGKPVNEMRGPVERKAAISYLRGLYMSTSGMGIVNPALIDERVFPTMKNSESVVLDNRLKEDRIEEGQQVRQIEMTKVNSGTDIPTLVQRLANTTDKNGGIFGYDAAYQLVKDRYAQLLATDQIDEPAIYELEARSVDPVTGQPYSVARPTFAEDIIVGAAKLKKDLKSAEDFEISSKADNWVKTRIPELPDRMSLDDIRRERLDFENLFPGIPIPKALSNALNLRAPKQFVDIAVEKFDTRRQNGESYTTAEVDATIPLSDGRRQRILEGASDYIENEKDRDAIKQPLKDIEDLVEQETNETLGTKAVTAGARQIISKLQEFYRKEYNRLRKQNPNMSREEAAAQAQTNTQTYYEQNRDNKENKFYIDQGKAPNLVQPIDPAVAKKYNVPSFDDLKNLQSKYGSNIYTAMDPKVEGKTALGFTAKDITDITTGNINDRLSSRLAQLSKYFAMSPIEILKQQAKALQMDLPMSPVAEQVSYAPKQAQDILMASYTPTTRSLSRAVAQTTGGQETYFPKAPMIDGEDSNIYIQESGQSSGQSPALIAGILWKENKFQKYGVSVAGAQGIAQIMPETAAEYGVNPNDWKASIQFVGQYLSAIKQHIKSDDDVLALAGYNWGMGNVEYVIEQLGEEQAIQWMLDPSRPALPDGTRLPYETWDYIDKIMDKAPTYGYGIARPGILNPQFLYAI